MIGKGWYLTIWGVAYLFYGLFHPEQPWGALFVVTGIVAGSGSWVYKIDGYYHSLERVSFVALASLAFARLIYIVVHGSLITGSSTSAIAIWAGMCFSHLIVAGLRDA